MAMIEIGRRAATVVPWRRLVLTLIILAAGLCLYRGITLPIIKLTKLYVWTDEHSLSSAVLALYSDGETFLAGVVLVFSIMLPTVKLSYLLVLASLPEASLRERRKTLRWVESIGKWSMHDVLILALTIVYLKSSGLSKATSMPGAQYFAASVVLIMLAYGWLKRTARAQRGGDVPSTIRVRALEAPDLSPFRRFLVFLLTTAAAGTLVAGITMPTIKLTQIYIWTDEHSILSAVAALFRDEEYFLAGLIFLFSVVFPALKLFYLIVVSTVGSRQPELRGRLLERLEMLGKWSMMDVLVLALIIFYVNASSFAEASALPGIYFFTTSVVLTMLAYGLVKKLG